MNKKLSKPSNRKPYSPPKIEAIRLAAEGSVLQGQPCRNRGVSGEGNIGSCQNIFFVPCERFAS
jgi:hypothetical protein